MPLASICEVILSYGISFTYCLLENPGIWGDILPEYEEEEEKKIVDQLTPEQFVQHNVFPAERVKALLTTLTMKYLIMTKDEVEEW